jgi:non-ribosomal peptide synthetase component E (peptide arylation enzyme)
MDQLPLTAAGKVDKKALRADIAEKQRAEEQLK